MYLNRSHGRLGREIDRRNRVRRAFFDAFAAKPALGKIYISDIAFDLDGIEGADLRALAAADAADRAGLAGSIVMALT